MPEQAPNLCSTGVVLVLDHDTAELVAIPTHCHRWDCELCGRVRLSKARAQAAAGKPERIITLTTRPRPGLSIPCAVRWMRGRWTALLRRLRRNYPRLEYMAFLELHKSGWPHLHILTRGCYVPQRQLSAWWLKLTGSFKVHIQAVDHTWKAINEATKYCLKTARQVNDACPELPVYTMSKGWLPPEWKEGDRPAGDRTCYAYAPMPWPEALELCEALDVHVEPRANSPGHFTLQHDGPLRAGSTSLSYDHGSYAEKCFVAALDLYFADPAKAHRDPVELRDRHEYASALDLHFQEKPSSYTTHDKAQLDLDRAGAGQGSQQIPMFIGSGAPCPF